MKKIIILAIVLFGLISNCLGQVERLEGPRLGITFLSDGTTSEKLNSNYISQLGWQWETRFTDDSLKFALLGEWVLMAGGFEKNMILPSISGIVGFRSQKGFECGIGANISVIGIAPIIAIGQNLKIGYINIPINIAFVPSIDIDPWIGDSGPTGSRITFTIGFNSSYYLK